jgi:hypothetical protein
LLLKNSRKVQSFELDRKKQRRGHGGYSGFQERRTLRYIKIGALSGKNEGTYTVSPTYAIFKSPTSDALTLQV